MRKISLVAAALLLTSTAAFAQSEVKRYPYLKTVSANDSFAWKMKKATWSDQDEVEFGQFVTRIGLAVESGKCRNFQSCMTKPEINPFVTTDPKGIRYFADCADVPYWLRTYFAFKKGLPLSVAINTAPRDPNDPKKGNRNSTVSGNRIIMRADSISEGGKFPNITHFLSSTTSHGLILDSISSGILRTPIVPGPNEPLADFYPVAITKNSIKPGTVIYTADGHVAVVYKVDADGNIRTLNGHPADPNAAQSPLSVRDYNDTFKRSRQEHGSIFKNFRPLQLVGATPDAQGNLIGGKIRFKNNSEIPDASTEQATLKFSDVKEYFRFVRSRMANGELRMDIITEFRRSLKNVCDLVQGRVDLVNQAVSAGMDRKTLDVGPSNIFSTHGDWENYSTPSRDVNIRVLFKNTLDELKTHVQGYQSGDRTYVYNGANLAQDLYNTYRDSANGCKVTYTSRSGITKSLDLEAVRTRMFKISFDPYHCADLRWGETTIGEKACGEDMRWYNAEQYLRNLTEKNSDNHALTVQQMETQNAKLNKPFEWNTNIIGFIQEIANATGVSLN